MQEIYLARHNKIWQKISTGETFSDKLTLKDGEKLTDYRQVPKPAEPPKQAAKQKAKSVEKPVYSFGETNNDKGVF